MKLLVILILTILILTACSSGDDSKHVPIETTLGQEIVVPTGYLFLDASAYGQYDNNVTYYCQQIESGRIFECTNGKFGREIIVPDGYFFIGASAYGKFTNNVTYYCGKNGTRRVFICDIPEPE